MKKILTLFLFLLSLEALAQNDTIKQRFLFRDSSRFDWEKVAVDWDDITWDETINLFYDPGYITITQGLGNMEPLLFEANIIPYYRIGINAIEKWAFILSPQIILRMYNEYSYPVKTPSYKPRITLVHQSSKHTREYHDWFQYISLFHHSNGQDGYFYTDSTNTVINTRNGSFSTNWVEAGVFESRAHSSRQYYAKLYAQYCYQQDTMLNGIYGRWRFNLDVKFEWDIAKTLSKLNFKHFDNKETIIANTFKFGVICGNMKHRDNIDWKRGIIDYTISFRPSFLQDVCLFVQYYCGEDYYNIYFNRIMQCVRIGLTAQSRFFTRESVIKAD